MMLTKTLLSYSLLLEQAEQKKQATYSNKPYDEAYELSGESLMESYDAGARGKKVRVGHDCQLILR